MERAEGMAFDREFQIFVIYSLDALSPPSSPSFRFLKEKRGIFIAARTLTISIYPETSLYNVSSLKTNNDFNFDMHRS